MWWIYIQWTVLMFGNYCDGAIWSYQLMIIYLLPLLEYFPVIISSHVEPSFSVMLCFLYSSIISSSIIISVVLLFLHSVSYMQTKNKFIIVYCPDCFYSLLIEIWSSAKSFITYVQGSADWRVLNWLCLFRAQRNN